MLSMLFALLWVQDLKPITFEMAFEDQAPAMLNFESRADGWIDDTHLSWVETEGQSSMSYSLDVTTGEKSEFQKTTAGVFGYGNASLTADRAHFVYVSEGDIRVKQLADGTEKALTRSAATEQNPWFSPDGTQVAFTRAGNLFVIDRESGLETQLTSDGSDLVYNGWASWVYFEEILGRASRYKAFWWSPDNRKIAFLRFDDSQVNEYQIYHTQGQYGTWEKTYYPKSGQQNPTVRFGVVDLDSRETTWMDFDEKEDAYLAWPFWTPDSQTIHVQWLNRDQNHLVIYACDATSGSKKAIYTEKQASWVEFFNDITYLQDGTGFILRSDKDGYRHLYLHDMDGKLRKRLTSGEFEVKVIEGVDEANGRIFFLANQSDSTNRDLMVVGLDGKKMKRVSPDLGVHQVEFSPDFTYYVDEFSDFHTPNRVGVYKADGTLVRQLYDRHNPEMDQYQLGKLESFRIPTDDGYQLPAWWLVPQDLDTSGKTKYGVIFRIYSGPDAPTVLNVYGARFGAARTWRDHYYANEGVITISVDHRASGHFGKKGVSLMHRNFSHWEVHDLSLAVKWLLQKPFIDAKRIGITGHSYGGYMTLLALTKAPELFTHGVAGSPVTDWQLYDTVYTERYMDRPQDNPEGYLAGSLLESAANLKGKMRLIHGDIDDNVHPQNSLQLVDKLTNLGIQFEFMLYPGSRHRIAQNKHHQDGEHAFWFRHFLNKEYGP